MKIYVIRHGETNANKEGRLQGWINEPLNELGVKLAKVTGTALQGVKFDACFSSPLDRALNTAKLVLTNSDNNNTNITIDQRLKEIHMGNWEGKYIKGENIQIPMERVKEFFENPFDFGHLPDGENAQEVCARTQAFFQDLIQKQDYDTVLVSTHGFAMRALLNPLYENSRDFWQGHVPYNCAVNIVEADRENCRLVGEERIYYDKSESFDRYAAK